MVRLRAIPPKLPTILALVALVFVLRVRARLNLIFAFVKVIRLAILLLCKFGEGVELAVTANSRGSESVGKD